VVSGWGMGSAYFVEEQFSKPLPFLFTAGRGDEIMRFNEIRERAKKDYRQYITDLGVLPPLMYPY
jgi:hypothetical protein